MLFNQGHLVVWAIELQESLRSQDHPVSSAYLLSGNVGLKAELNIAFGKMEIYGIGGLLQSSEK